jgi:subtilisin family serine protease
MRRNLGITVYLTSITTALLLGAGTTGASASSGSASSGSASSGSASSGSASSGSASSAASAPAAAGLAPTAASAGAPASVVTLITGDTVSVGADGHPTVTPAAGRANMQFITQTIDGDLQVVPADALGLISRGQLDSRLFDVTELREAGYGDGRTDLPLIIQRGSGRSARSTAGTAQPDSTTDATTETSAKIVADVPALHASAIHQPKSRLPKLWHNLTGGETTPRNLHAGVTKVWLDGMRRPSLDVSVPQIGAPIAWAAGQDGTGALVAVLDTGIDATHPDLAGKIDAEKNFTTDPDGDQVGHGTHVASTIAGTGAASDGKYRGVAPGAHLLDGKVCIKAINYCPDSAILAGMQWAVDQHADVVNLSLGGPDTWDLDPLEEAVNTLTASSGTLFVIAAGNESSRGTISSPASADAALAVGAVKKDESIADFSNQGPRTHDIGLKPEITAPGVDIMAARAKDGGFGSPGELYTLLSGTSMATPHVSGSAAILAAAHPNWKATRLKATLIASAKPNPALATIAQGAGRVDVGRAITQRVTVSPSTVTFGLAVWPHPDDPIVTRTLTYQNSSEQSLSLQLALTTDGPDGAPVPAGMFTLSASTLTVPAGGTARVTLSSNTRIGDTLGTFGGRVTATAGDQLTSTPFVVQREGHSHDVTVKHTGRDGKVPKDYTTVLYRLDTGQSYNLSEEDGTVQARLPDARYTLVSWIYENKGEADQTLTLITQPVLDLDRDRTVVIDARAARPVSVTPPRRDATSVLTEVDVTVPTTQSYPVGYSVLATSFDNLYLGQVTGAASLKGFVTRFGEILAKADSAGTFDQSPFAYYLTWYQDGKLPTGFHRVVQPARLAEVRAEHLAQAPGAFAWKRATAMRNGVTSNLSANLQFTLPFTRIEYYSTEDGVKWQADFQEMLPGVDDCPWCQQWVSSATDPFVSYRAGSYRKVRWNQGVFGPAMPEPGYDTAWVTRAADTLNLSPLMASDGAGRDGSSQQSGAHTTVYRNGTVFADTEGLGGSFGVPPESADYRVVITAERGAPLSLTTRSSVTWTFRSGHVKGDTPQRLPVSVVRFTPMLDAQSSAPAGRSFSIPVTVQTQPHASVARPDRLGVEVSYDDGVTWVPAPLRWTGAGWAAQVSHPRKPGFVSLRATAKDGAGNGVSQTLIRAYRTT